MTGGALYFFMVPPDFKFGIPVVIELIFIPTGFRMAFIAFFAILPMVLVIDFMTGITVFLRMTFLIEYSAGFMLVAAITAHNLMLSANFKFSFLIMIKMAFLPLFLAVAGLALSTIAPLMRIINRMAGITFCWRVLVSVIGVAALTAGFFMLTLQRKIGFTVVKFNFCPSHLTVTGMAFFTQLFIMCIILLVAGIALCRGFSKFFLLFMTPRTLCLLVATL